MIKNGLDKYKYKKVLMLQGPIGPFFNRLAKDLKSVGAEVYKINFNAGDCLFYPKNYIPFKGSIKEWPEFVERILEEKKIDVVMLFGDCRYMHRIARKIADKKGIEVGVFEEGYVRPDYITLDKYGVNGYSRLPKDPDFYLNLPESEAPKSSPVGQTLLLSIGIAFLYWSAAIFFRFRYPRYRHHRPLKASEALKIIPYAWRKIKYSILESGIQKKLTTDYSGKFFLVPLQVYSDSQIIVHSDYFSNQNFMEEVIESFSRNAPKDTVLVFKHHPIDRGYNDYTEFLNETTKKHKLPKSRWIYIHDQHLPTLLSHARGVVLVNSTVGLQALYHGCPMKVCGRAIYDFRGLTYQGALYSFWKDSSKFKVNMELFEKFRNYVINTTQINGNLYKKLKVKNSYAGLIWPEQNKQAANASNEIFENPILGAEKAS